MQNSLLYKLGIIGILFLFLQVPLWTVSDLIHERTSFRNEARADIARSWTDAQGIIGPILVVPYLETVINKLWDEQLKAYRNEPQQTRKYVYLLPNSMHMDGGIQIEERQRGLYSVPVYTADLKLDGRFSTQPIVDLMQGADNLKLEPAYLVISVSDLRGIVEQPRLSWKINEATQVKPEATQVNAEATQVMPEATQEQTKEIEFRSGSKAFSGLAGMHAFVEDIDPKIAQTPVFSTKLALRGMEKIQAAAIAKDTKVTLRSSWQHPSFIGHYLPREHRIDATGFEATWQASSFSGDLESAVKNCGDDRQCNVLLEDNFGVSFITPVDIYQQGERAVKYGILFIGLTFLAFFLFEVIKQLRLHVMHYLLVGLALATFYLLLISLSEHLGFGLSYLLATLGCTMLITFYISGVMRDWLLGLAFAGKFLALYGMLYVILQSEDYALLMGSLLIFTVLGIVMIVTRDLDWYAVGEQMGRVAEEIKIANISTVNKSTTNATLQGEV